MLSLVSSRLSLRRVRLIGSDRVFPVSSCHLRKRSSHGCSRRRASRSFGPANCAWLRSLSPSLSISPSLSLLSCSYFCLNTCAFVSCALSSLRRYLEGHRGTLTTQAATKKANRRCEFLLRDLEFFASLAASLAAAYAYPKDELLRLWKLLLLCACPLSLSLSLLLFICCSYHS